MKTYVIKLWIPAFAGMTSASIFDANNWEKKISLLRLILYNSVISVSSVANNSRNV